MTENITRNPTTPITVKSEAYGGLDGRSIGVGYSVVLHWDLGGIYVLTFGKITSPPGVIHIILL
jgi:hypothetical protein